MIDRLRRTQAQIHLLTLAFSDLTVNVAGIVDVIFTTATACNLCDPCTEVQNEYFHVYFVTFTIWHLATGVNRMITLYITFVRARTLFDLNYSISSQKMTQRRVMIELGAYTLIWTVVGHVWIYMMEKILTWYGVPSLISYYSVVFVGLVVTILTMLIFAAYILIKLQYCDSSGKDFQRLVALVALVFSGTNVISAAGFGFAMIEANIDVSTGEAAKYLFWPVLAISLNSSVNLLVYLAASRNFRRAFSRFWKDTTSALFVTK